MSESQFVKSFEGDTFCVIVVIYSKTVVDVRYVFHDIGRLTQRFKDNFMIRRFFSYQFCYFFYCKKTMGLLVALCISFPKAMNLSCASPCILP